MGGGYLRLFLADRGGQMVVPREIIDYRRSLEARGETIRSFVMVMAGDERLVEMMKGMLAGGSLPRALAVMVPGVVEDEDLLAELNASIAARRLEAEEGSHLLPALPGTQQFRFSEPQPVTRSGSEDTPQPASGESDSDGTGEGGDDPLQTARVEVKFGSGEAIQGFDVRIFHAREARLWAGGFAGGAASCLGGVDQGLGRSRVGCVTRTSISPPTPIAILEFRYPGGIDPGFKLMAADGFSGTGEWVDDLEFSIDVVPAAEQGE
jgi:hypothetical protein